MHNGASTLESQYQGRRKARRKRSNYSQTSADQDVQANGAGMCLFCGNSFLVLLLTYHRTATKEHDWVIGGCNLPDNGTDNGEHRRQWRQWTWYLKGDMSDDSGTNGDNGDNQMMIMPDHDYIHGVGIRLLQLQKSCMVVGFLL